MDESSDTCVTAQLSIFIRGVDSSLYVTEQLRIKINAWHNHRKGIFKEVSKYIIEMNLPWDKLVGLTTDGTPAMCG